MESIDIITGQNVVIRYAPASLLRRGAAISIDFLIMIIYFYIIIYSIDQFSFLYYMSYGLRNLTTFLLFLPVIMYHFLFELLMNGKTPGKMILGIRVTNKDGSTPGLTSYFLRWILLPVDLFPMGIGIGGLSIAISKYQQRIGDMAAGTIVVRTAKPKRLRLDEDFIEYSDNYQPRLGKEVELLSDGQIRFISGMLSDPRNKRLVANNIYDLSRKVKSIIKAESPMDDRTFLETVVRDYNYYAWHG